MFRPHRSISAALACFVALTATLAGCSDDDGPERTLEAFLAGWRSGNLDRVAFIAPTGDKIGASDVAKQIRELSGELADTPPGLRATGGPKQTGDLADVTVEVDWALPGGAHWKYPSPVRLSDSEQGWRVIWEPTMVHQRLAEGGSLGLRRVAGERAAVLDAAGQPIVTKRPVVIVGIQPNAVANIKDLVSELDKAFRSIAAPVDTSGLEAAVARADEGAFVEVAVLRRPDYLRIRGRIQPLDGTKFIEEQRDLSPARPFARALLGAVEPVLREDMERKPDVYEVGDYVGHGGLQQAYEDRLRATPGQRVVVVQKAADGTTSDTEVFRVAPKPGTPLKITIDPKVQRAADSALGGGRKRAALVALRVTDGAVLAAANGPNGGTANLAFTAEVPPGSTFKMVSALGLLDLGAVTPTTPVNCPKTATVGGQTFRNSNNFVLGRVPFREDFARSCNTAFAQLAEKLGPDGLAAVGGRLGLGGEWQLGVDAFTGTVSTGGSAAERAAAAFGQGTTLVSPLAMAAATAAVARGRWQPPTLVLDPAPASAPAASASASGPPLKATSVRDLQALMRAVVTTGTAEALRDVPGAPVHGKTGTAEFNNNEKNAHGWFVGWQGDIAFAVFVENGGSSTTSAVPIAERFLRAVAAG